MGKKSKRALKKRQKKLSGTKSIDVASLYQAGLNHFKNKDYHAAIVEWSKIPDQSYTAEIKSHLAEACFRKGLQLCQQLPDGDREKINNQIIATLTQATNLQPNQSIYHFHLGLAYHRLNNHKKAISSYRKAADISINDRYLLHLILACLQQENVTEANFYWQLMNNKNELLSIVFSIFDQSIENLSFKTDTVENCFLTGLVHLITKDFDLALQSFENALQLKIKSSDNKLIGYIYYFLGLLEQHKNEKKARDYWDQLLKFRLTSERLKKNLAIYFFNNGINLAQDGKFKRAISHFNKALKIQPHHKVFVKNLNLARFHYANQIAQQGNIEDAIKLWYSSPIKKDINRILNIALALDKLEQHKEANFQWTEAIKQWKREFRSNGDNGLKDYLVIAHKHLAQNYLKINDEKRAIREFENVLQLVPNDIEIHAKLGELLMEGGRWNSAVKEFNAILNLKPDDIDALLNVAIICEQLCEEDKAVETLQKILTIEPGNLQARRKMGEIFHEQAHEEWNFENYSEAIKLFRQQIEIDPKKISGYACLSHLYFEIGKKNLVDKLLEDYIKTDPKNPIAYVKVAQTYYEVKSKVKANKYLTMAEQLNPTDIQLLIEIGKTLFDFSHRKAKTYFDRAIKLAPDKAKLYYEIGSWIGTDNSKMALSYLTNHVQLEKENAKAFIELGILYSMENKIRDSQKALSTAMRLAKEQGDDELIMLINEFKLLQAEQFDIFGDLL